jgi:hypothetical protein
MTFRGVKLIRPIVVPFSGSVSRSELYFDNQLDLATREAWCRAGYPVYFDTISSKYYTWVDNSVLEKQTNTNTQVDVKCECGGAAVKAVYHSGWCPKSGEAKSV